MCPTQAGPPSISEEARDLALLLLTTKAANFSQLPRTSIVCELNMLLAAECQVHIHLLVQWKLRRGDWGPTVYWTVSFNRSSSTRSAAFSASWENTARGLPHSMHAMLPRMRWAVAMPVGMPDAAFCAALLASDGQLVSVVAMPLSEWNVRKWPSRAGSGCGSGSQYRSLKTSERGFLQTPDGHGVCPHFRTYRQFKSKSAKAEQHHTLTIFASSVKAMSLSECHHAQHQRGDTQSRTETHHGSSYITKKQPCSNNPPEMRTGGLCSEFHKHKNRTSHKPFDILASHSSDIVFTLNW